MRLPAFYPILDTPLVESLGLGTEAAAEAILEGGALILQLRHKGHFSRSVFEQAEKVARLCRNGGALFVIDDRPDLATLLDCGCHVGQDDLPPEDARTLLGPDRVLGYSTHNARQLVDARRQPVDYLAIGPIFETASKERPDPVIGVAGLPALRKLTARPLVAIGGISRSNCQAVLDAGADSVAVIRDVFPEPCTYQTLRSRVEEWLQLTNR